MADENKTCRTCRYWQGILPKGKDTTWSGCIVGRYMLDKKKRLDPAWVAEVGEDNFELMGGNFGIVATREKASCSKYKLQLGTSAPVGPAGRIVPEVQGQARTLTQTPLTDALQETLKVLTHNVYHEESPDEGLILDTILHYCWDK